MVRLRGRTQTRRWTARTWHENRLARLTAVTGEPIAGTDSLLPKLTETSSVIIRVPVTETVAPKLTDAVSGAIVSVSSRADSIPVGFADAATLQVILNRSDSLTPKLTESISLDIGGTVSKSSFDALAALITEASLTSASLSRTDSLTPKLTEAVTMFKALGLGDSLTPKLTEGTAGITVVLGRTDTLLPKTTEASTLDTGGAALPGDISDLAATPVDYQTSDITFTPATASTSHEWRFSPTGQASWSAPATLPDNTGSNEVTGIA